MDCLYAVMVLFLIWPQSIHAHFCLPLGPEPSFILKPVTKQHLEYSLSHLMGQHDLQVSYVRPMGGGYYVARFRSLKHKTCYLEDEVNEIARSIKRNASEMEVIPNLLSSAQTIDLDVQWSFSDPPGGIDLLQAWHDARPNNPIITAVLDTGILEHHSLTDNILPGVHFTRAGEYGESAIPSCIHCPGNYHGTMVSGLIGATGKLAYGQNFFGVAPSLKILPINVFTQFNDAETCGHPPCMLSYLSDQLSALFWLMGESFADLMPAPQPVKVVNMSLGHISLCPSIAKQAFNKAEQMQLSIVVAAGNSNIDVDEMYPANCPNVISVAATGRLGEKAGYSNWGKSITLSAPGGNKNYGILSTTLKGYRTLQGTSLAAPHVTGVIALIYAINDKISHSELRHMIASQETTTEIKDKQCIQPSQRCGVGILNASLAIKQAKLYNASKAPAAKSAYNNAER